MWTYDALSGIHLRVETSLLNASWRTPTYTYHDTLRSLAMPYQWCVVSSKPKKQFRARLVDIGKGFRKLEPQTSERAGLRFMAVRRRLQHHDPQQPYRGQAHRSEAPGLQRDMCAS